VNNFDRSEKGSLWAFLNRCKTSFGRRLLKEWITRPLLQPADIAKRSAAVDEFLTGDLSGHIDRVRVLLKSVPDLERLLARVHSNGLRSKGVNHPDSRAVMYEATTYNSRKIKDFADTLAGFDVLVKIGTELEGVSMKSALLQKVTKPVSATSTAGGKFPLKEMSSLLKFYREIFDEKQAKREGCIKPKVSSLLPFHLFLL
jgi:DNA mismatch repair protein MSH6